MNARSAALSRVNACSVHARSTHTNSRERSGALTGYHWGLTRKQAMLGWEQGLVFHLYPEELGRALREPGSFERRAKARRKEWLTAAKAVVQLG